MARATAVAHSNIALVKYWGKRAGVDAALNLPEVGSISITLGGLSTTTTVETDPGRERDTVALTERGRPAGGADGAAKVSRLLDLVRARVGSRAKATVQSDNDFPTGAGLASSASGFAALALAASRAYGLELAGRELSTLARQGSGSAARSIFGGFVELHRGGAADGSDCFAEPLLDPARWPLAVLVAVTSEAHKDVGSTSGMTRTKETSPYYDAWAGSHPTDLTAARAAIAARDFDALAEVTEASCLKMHGLMLSARPGLLYWNPTTVRLIEHVRGMRRRGLPCCFTIDAGPQVKVVCAADALGAVRRDIEPLEGVLRVIESALGGPARLS